MIVFPDPNVETEYTDPNGSVWEFNGTGWVRQAECPECPECPDGSNPISTPAKDTLIYRADSLPWNNYGSVSFPAGEQWSTAGPPMMLKINNQNWLTVNFKGDADQAFYWLKMSDVGSFSSFKRLPYPRGVDGRGTVYNQFQKSGMSHHQSVVDGDTAYLLGNNEIVKVTESEATFFATVDASNPEDNWVRGPTQTRRTFDHYQNNTVGYLHKASESDLVTLLVGEGSGTSRPVVKAKRFSKADGSIVDTTYSPPLSADNGGTDRYIFGGWIEDPRDPHDAIGFFLYGNYATNDYPKTVVYHYKGATGVFQAFQASGSVNRRVAYTYPSHFTLVANSSDGFAVEYVGNFGSSTPLMQTMVFSLPSDRASISTKTRFGNSSNLDYGIGGNKTNGAGTINCTPVKDAVGTLIYNSPVLATHLASPSFGKYYVTFKNNSGTNDFYDGVIEESWSKTTLDGVGSYSNDAIKHLHTKTIIGAAPPMHKMSGGEYANLTFLGVRSDTGYVIVHRYRADKSAQIICWKPDATSSLKVMIEGGKVVGSPVPTSNGPDAFASGTWVDVRTIADNLDELEKLDDGTFEFDEENNIAIWTRKAVPMTEEEIAARNQEQTTEE